MQVLTPSTESPKRPASDRRVLTAIKVALALLLAGFLIVGDDDNTWPLVTWPMFDASGSRPPKNVSSLRVRAIAADGQYYEFPAGALSDTLAGNSSEQIIQTTFDADLSAAAQHDAQARLIGMVRSVLPGIDVTEIQAWQLTWKVDPRAPLPIAVDSPSKETLLGSFRLAEVEADS